MDVRKNRRAMADGYLRDAVSQSVSVHSQASAAFDAGYIYLLVALDAPTGSPDGTHPGVALLHQAVERFGLERPVMRAAEEFMDLQYSPAGVAHLLDALLLWARQMKALAGAP